MSANLKQVLVIVGAVGVLLGLLLAGQWLGERYLGAEPPGGAPAVLLPAAQCSPLGAACVAHRDGVALALRLPPAVQPMARFAVEVRVTGVERVGAVVVDFEMPGMDMGLNRARLQPADGPGLWAGEACLPICMSGRLDWTARVSVQAADGRVYRAEYLFAMSRGG